MNHEKIDVLQLIVSNVGCFVDAGLSSESPQVHQNSNATSFL
jgi:hypothetical protein